jgi:hypothetical protein
MNFTSLSLRPPRWLLTLVLIAAALLVLGAVAIASGTGVTHHGLALADMLTGGIGTLS